MKGALLSNLCGFMIAVLSFTSFEEAIVSDPELRMMHPRLNAVMRDMLRTTVIMRDEESQLDANVSKDRIIHNLEAIVLLLQCVFARVCAIDCFSTYSYPLLLRQRNNHQSQALADLARQHPYLSRLPAWRRKKMKRTMDKFDVSLNSILRHLSRS